MSVKNSLWAVAKVIIGTALLAIIITLVGTCVVVFSGYSQIKSVGENMQMELTKNNTLYTASYVSERDTGDQLAGFAAQLQDIANRSAGAYTFKGIRIVNADDTVTELVTIQNTETGEFNYNQDIVGAYGDFRTIQLVFDIHTSVMLPQGSPAVKNLTEHVTTSEDVAFEFVAPCLRYLKDGDVTP